MGPGWKKLSKVVCKICNYEWGIQAMWENRLSLPLIKIDGFKIKNSPTAEPLPYKKWRDCPFAPIEASLNLTLIAMMGLEADSEAKASKADLK